MESTLAGNDAALFSEHQGRRQHLHEHHAGVQARVRRQEAGQAAQVGVDQVLDAPLADAAQVGQGRRRQVGGQGDRLAVEVAAR